MDIKYFACAALLLCAQHNVQSAVIAVKPAGNVICSGAGVDVVEYKENGSSTYFIVTPEKVIALNEPKQQSGIIKRAFWGTIDAMVVRLILSLFATPHSPQINDTKDFLAIAAGIYAAVTMD